MPHCENCGTKWSWKGVMKLSFKGKKECPNCQKRQYISTRSNFWVTFFISMGFLTPMNVLRYYYEIGWPLIILGFLIYMPLVLLLAPFLYKLSNTGKRFGKTVE
ncbi:TIGR04104 family putative zinc finger protein [Planococcus sp. SSTMD024]|uniref:TIGR04104 family putative zinc finger protein n=1 Tax=Planococcus sp. SSTMD024 TaxID=3242163 RepID=UPI00351E0996